MTFATIQTMCKVDLNQYRPLTESERRRTEYYCRYDVDATEILWKLRQGYLDNKVAVGAKRGLTDRKAMYMTNAKLTSVYLQAEKPEKPWTDERNYQYPDKLLRQYIPQEIFDFFDRLHDPNVPDIDLFGGYDQYGRVSNVVSKCFPFCTTVLNNPVSGLKLQGHNIIGISLLNTRRAVALLTLSKVKPSFLKLYSLIIQDLLYFIVFCFQTPGRAGTLAA